MRAEFCVLPSFSDIVACVLSSSAIISIWARERERERERERDRARETDRQTDRQTESWLLYLNCIHAFIYVSLSVTSNINYIVARCLMNFISRHVPLSGHDDVALFE